MGCRYVRAGSKSQVSVASHLGQGHGRDNYRLLLTIAHQRIQLRGAYPMSVGLQVLFAGTIPPYYVRPTWPWPPGLFREPET